MSNDWTNKLRDQLTDYQEPVSHDLWAEIEQSLAQSKKVGDEETDVKKTPQARYVVLKRWSVAAAIALLGVGGSYVYLHDDEPGQANLAVQSSFSTASGSSRTSSAVRAEAQSAGSENAILLAENNASAHQVNRHSYPPLRHILTKKYCLLFFRSFHRRHWRRQSRWWMPARRVQKTCPSGWRRCCTALARMASAAPSSACAAPTP